MTRILENTNDVVVRNLINSMVYYDDFGRPIRVITDNHRGGKDVVYTNYNFSGQVTQTTTLDLLYNIPGSSDALTAGASYNATYQRCVGIPELLTAMDLPVMD